MAITENDTAETSQSEHVARHEFDTDSQARQWPADSPLVAARDFDNKYAGLHRTADVLAERPRTAAVHPFLAGPFAFYDCPVCPCAFGEPTTQEFADRQAREHDALHHAGAQS